ncbi:MAG TPA: TonB family protein [Candidatus Synoicihabitans sp.]|nr:TonB family protein [Candidatus Synoicihabitans sp.]
MKTKYLLAFGVSLAAVLPAPAAQPESERATTAGVTKVVRVPGMDKAPKAVKVVDPIYPRELRERGVQGFATVEMLVDSTGRVVETTVVRTTNPDFGVRALEAARQWAFEPAEARGQKIMTRVQVPFQFVMPQVAALEQRR